MFWFSTKRMYEIFLILRRLQRDVIITVHRYSCQVPAFFSYFNQTKNLSIYFQKNTQISNFIKIPVKSKLFHANEQSEGQTWSQWSLFAILRQRPKTGQKVAVMSQSMPLEWLRSILLCRGRNFGKIWSACEQHEIQYTERK